MRRHRDHGFGDPFTKELAGVLHELAQDLCRDLLGRVLLAIHLETGRTVRPGHDIEGDRVELAGDLVVVSADEPLRGVDGALRVQDRLSPGHLSYEPLPGVEEGDHRRCGPIALGIGDNLRLSPFHRRNDRIRRTKVDAYSRCHGSLLSPDLPYLDHAVTHRPWRHPVNGVVVRCATACLARRRATPAPAPGTKIGNATFCCLRTPKTGRMLRSGRNQLTVLQGQHREFDA